MLDLHIIEPVPTFLIANKIDMNESQEVGFNEAREFANLHHSEYRQTSAKTGEGIDDLFKSIGSMLLKNRVDTTVVSTTLVPNEKPAKNCC
jgi:predicted GTPase